MKRLPFLPTLLVAAAVATMVALGIWQLQRAGWKQELIARFERAARLPPLSFPPVPRVADALLYRLAVAPCLQPTGWRAEAGRNRAGESGWSHVVTCRTGAEGQNFLADMGWSRSSAAPIGWSGGRVIGQIVRDRSNAIRLVSDEPAPGLIPSAAPSPSSLPDNHIFYAAQWFFFAAAAAVIYVLALRRRT